MADTAQEIIDIGENSLTVDFDVQSDSTQAAIFVYTNDYVFFKDASIALLGNGSNPNRVAITVEGLLPSTKYNYYVSEVRGDGSSHNNNFAPFTTLAAPLPKYVISPPEIERRAALEPDHNASVVTKSKKEFE
jgi:hypothetical protein